MGMDVLSIPESWDRVWYPFLEWISRGVNLMECGLCHRKGISCPVLVECALFPGGDENTPGETYVCAPCGAWLVSFNAEIGIAVVIRPE